LRAHGAITRARCCSGSLILAIAGGAGRLAGTADRRAHADRDAGGASRDRDRLLRLPAVRLESIRAAEPGAGAGHGLNPLLQDPASAFHPPTLYLGYVGISIAFSFAVGALVTRDVGPAFAAAMRPWVLAAWVMLTLGITAGSYWAYYELGWGGWWFWDPVENASLMPWLAATALLHSVTVLATRDSLRAWTVMLAVVAFSMSMVGTFLVRSGILTSVHAFAVDPQRGRVHPDPARFYIGGALTLFGLRVGTVKEGATFEAVSREGALVANNLLLSAILGIVLVGTLYPLGVEAVTGEKLSVGPAIFQHGSRADRACAGGCDGGGSADPLAA
jgi:cytochrome c-type biogenesis protein CcmF